jgi:hypothetical protein
MPDGRQYETYLVTLNGVTFLPSTVYLSFNFITLLIYYLTKTDPVVAEVVSRRSVIAEARIHYQVSPCGIFGGRSGTLDRIFSEYCGLFLSSFHQCSVLTNPSTDAV